MKNVNKLVIFLFVFFTSIFAQCDHKFKEIRHSDSTNSTKFNIENCVRQFSFEDTTRTKVGYQYWFVDKNFLDGRTLKMSVVKPHAATHAPHTHLEDEFFFVLEGTAEFYLDGKTTTGTPYSSFYCPPNSTHGIRNLGDTELKYLVIKKYILDK